MWQPIETYIRPTEEFEYLHPRALFYSPKTGVVLGRCILWDKEEGRFDFYDRDGYEVLPTHWMPLPEPPK